MTTEKLDTICTQLDAIRNELRAVARKQRRANKDLADEVDKDCDKLTEISDHITLYVTPFITTET